MYVLLQNHLYKEIWFLILLKRQNITENNQIIFVQKKMSEYLLPFLTNLKMNLFIKITYNNFL